MQGLRAAYLVSRLPPPRRPRLRASLFPISPSARPVKQPPAVATQPASARPLPLGKGPLSCSEFPRSTGIPALETQFRVRAETHQLQCRIIRFAINQNQIGPNVTIPMVLPFANKGMVAMLRVQRPIVCEGFDDFRKVFCQKISVRAIGFAFQVALKDRRLPNFSHRAPLAARPALPFPLPQRAQPSLRPPSRHLE